MRTIGITWLSGWVIAGVTAGLFGLAAPTVGLLGAVLSFLGAVVVALLNLRWRGHDSATAELVRALEHCQQEAARLQVELDEERRQK